ncbi:MAG: DUF2339 domain-containing protein [Lachnospiraceae bacterium]|nr:DUF2339 domain-containing protein [Lachnospiraceae bacterium]
MVKDSNLLTSLVLIMMAIVNFAYIVFEKYTNRENEFNKIDKIVLGIEETLVIFIYSFFIYYIDSAILQITFSTILLVFGLFKVSDLINKKHAGLGVFYAIKFTWLTVFPITVIGNLMEMQMVFSIVCMLISVICIIFGFKYSIKSVRVYGLILTITSVVKMVIVDVWDQNSLLRVGALIIGGIICFGISAIYNKFEKKQITTQKVEEYQYER